MKTYYLSLGILAALVLGYTIIYSIATPSGPTETVGSADTDEEARATIASPPVLDWTMPDAHLAGTKGDSASGLPGTDLIFLMMKHKNEKRYYFLGIDGGPSDEVGYEFFFSGEGTIQGRVVIPDRAYFWSDGKPYDPGAIDLHATDEGIILGTAFPHGSVSVAVFSFRRFKETRSSEASYDLFQFEGALQSPRPEVP